MAQLPNRSVDFVLADPSYLVHYRASDGRTVPNDDNDAWMLPAFRQLYRLLRPHRFAISFYGWSHVDRFVHAFRSAGFRIVGHLVFAKRYTSSRRYLGYQHEQAYLLAKGAPLQPVEPISDLRSWDYTGNKLHPTQKPVSALVPLVESFSRPDQIVIDPFCGSGSTLVAARQTGRRFIGFEIDPTYATIARTRLQTESMKRD